jgi:cell division septal protein FtsQ
MENVNLKNEGNNAKTVLAAVLMLLIWSIVTLLLGISVVGWVALAMMLDDEDGWFSIPSKCVKSLG